MPEPVPDPHERLREFLAGRDVLCPVCSSNLRDHTTDRCPECDARLDVWNLRRRGLQDRPTSRMILVIAVVLAVAFVVLVAYFFRGAI